MPFVLDASISACWAFKDEDHPKAIKALDELKHTSCLVPAIWWFEIRNIIVINERRNRITTQQGTAFLRRVSQLGIIEDSEVDGEQALHLARLHRLTIYDAAYLELAQRKHLPLATLDSELLRAAKAESVALLE
ncbi:MAG: type II toxin-antitoxin system VapC family toxin [Acidobacteriaceae bacterium]